MPRSEELKHVNVHLRYRKRASKLICKLSERIEELEKTPTGSEVITLASDYTNYDCAFPFVFILCFVSVRFTGGFLFYYFLLTHGPHYLQTILREQAEVQFGLYNPKYIAPLLLDAIIADK